MKTLNVTVVILFFSPANGLGLRENSFSEIVYFTFVIISIIRSKTYRNKQISVVHLKK